MKKIEEMTMKDLLDESTFIELFNMDNTVDYARTIVDLRQRAKQLGSVRDFNEILKAYKSIVDEEVEMQTKSAEVVGYTNFEGDYPRMECGDWLADETGVYKVQWTGKLEMRIIACYHPILPILRLRNMESQEENICIAFKRRGKWHEITVSKEIVASANKIVALSKYGIAVTSENARNLVNYLSDVENLNDREISVETSSSKLGWHKDIFLPYDKGIAFDGNMDFRDLFGSIKENGDYNVWLNHILELRKTGRKEIKLALAASFASVIVGTLEALPFVVDFWNKSGGGKTVLMMLSASVWADPSEHMYIGNFDQTPVGLEVRADLLNSLPMLLDDTSNAPRWTKDDFERLVYMLCSGKGKSRSNKTLGMQRERHWRLCTITNGERPISDYATQGGAINRVIECLCTKKIFDEPRETLEVIRENYGFAGKLFVEIVKNTDKAKLKAMFKEYNNILFAADKTAKQIAAASVLLVADKLATDHIFKDGLYLSTDTLKDMLVSQSDMSDDQRCYDFIIDKVARNPARFEIESSLEQWGIKDMYNGKKYILFYTSALEDICEQGKYSLKSFLAWAKESNILETDPERMTKQKRVGTKRIRFYWIASEAKTEENVENKGFLDDLPDEIPF